jgi:hypothetical protein
MYTSTNAQLKIGGKLAGEIVITEGFKWGWSLCPTLFNVCREITWEPVTNCLVGPAGGTHTLLTSVFSLDLQYNQQTPRPKSHKTHTGRIRCQKCLQLRLKCAACSSAVIVYCLIRRNNVGGFPDCCADSRYLNRASLLNSNLPHLPSYMPHSM